MTSFRSLAFSLLTCSLLIGAIQAQNVWTWHNNNQRTGWQDSEFILTQDSVRSSFGKVFQYTVSGEVYAQPLAIASVVSSQCPHTWPCDMVFVATETDMLYAFDATGRRLDPLWVTDLAYRAGGIYLNCRPTPPPLPCAQDQLVLYPEIGVTGTPVIDTQSKILYVVTLVYSIGNAPSPIQYYIHAIDIATGNEMPHSPQLIAGSVPGRAPNSQCGTSSGGSIVSFDATQHLQRAGCSSLTAEYTLHLLRQMVN